MKPTLLIMAAGMASRYGSMKQIQEFGPGGATIMDYSIYDAIEAGFKRVVFIIREDFAENFKKYFRTEPRETPDGHRGRTDRCDIARLSWADGELRAMPRS